jgi:antitoxin (DNA-binding transcriptional repressor) of toxin-antitoxin stability system
MRSRSFAEARHVRGHLWALPPLVAACRSICYDGFVTRILPQRELRNNNAKVIDAVIAGETFIVTRNGEQVAELRPAQPHRRTFVPRAEIAALVERTSRIDRHKFRAELDRLIDQSL